MNLKELSALLNLSATTVSRALNGYPEVNAETRARVIAAACAHGYAPHQNARRLATGRTMAIGHVIPLTPHQVINPLFAEFVAGCGETYSAAGYDMILSVVPEAEELDGYRSLVRQRKVDGIIVHGPRMVDPRIELLRQIDLPFVIHGRPVTLCPADSWIDIANRRAFQRATEHLLDLGHRRIALLNGLESEHFAHRRRQGFEAALAARGLAPDPRTMRSAEMAEPYGHAAVEEMMRLPEPPSAFLTASLITALGVLRAVRARGLEPGRDVSIATHDDDLSFIKNTDPGPLFTATHSPIRAAGRRAAEILIERIADPETAPRQELWDVALIPGRSTGPFRGRPADA
jgi:LacI family transcriptional regulator